MTQSNWVAAIEDQLLTQITPAMEQSLQSLLRRGLSPQAVVTYVEASAKKAGGTSTSSICTAVRVWLVRRGVMTRFDAGL